MSSRYYARDWDTCGDVWDTQTQRVVSRHDFIHDAYAEAARLNAETPKRAAAVTGWALISHGEIKLGSIRATRDGTEKNISAFHGDRIALVLIEEIEE